MRPAPGHTLEVIHEEEDTEYRNRSCGVHQRTRPDPAPRRHSREGAFHVMNPSGAALLDRHPLTSRPPQTGQCLHIIN